MQKKIFILAACLNIAFASFAQDYSLFGTHNKPSPIYNPGESMEFTVKLLDGEKTVAGKKLKWTRTGDDGITQNGEGVSTAEGFKITSSTNKPGFVRIYVTAWSEDGKPVNAKPNQQGQSKTIFLMAAHVSLRKRFRGFLNLPILTRTGRSRRKFWLPCR